VHIEEEMSDDIEQVFSKAKLTQYKGGVLKVEGIKNDILVNVYNSNGIFVDSAISKNCMVTVDTHLQPGSVAIVRIGIKSIKVIIK
jgi:hypothetical protein